MTSFKADIHGLTGLNRKMVRFAKEFPKFTQDIMYKWAQQTRRMLKRPYPQKNTKKMRWVSEKQRIYVMAAISRGDIVVPYRRSGDLANRWSAKRIPNGVSINNSHKAAKYVIGDNAGGSQYWMHEGRWYIARREIDGQVPKLRQMLVAGIKEEWKK